MTDAQTTHFIAVMLQAFKDATQRLMAEWETEKWPAEDQRELPVFFATAQTMYLVDGCRAAKMTDAAIVQTVRRVLTAVPRIQ